MTTDKRFARATALERIKQLLDEGAELAAIVPALEEATGLHTGRDRELLDEALRQAKAGVPAAAQVVASATASAIKSAWRALLTK